MDSWWVSTPSLVSEDPLMSQLGLEFGPSLTKLSPVIIIFLFSSTAITVFGASIDLMGFKN